MLFIAIIARCLVQTYLSKRFIMSNPTQTESLQGDVLLYSLSTFTAVTTYVVLKVVERKIQNLVDVWWFSSTKQHSTNLVQNNWQKVQLRRQKQSLS